MTSGRISLEDRLWVTRGLERTWSQMLGGWRCEASIAAIFACGGLGVAGFSRASCSIVHVPKYILVLTIDTHR